MSEPIENSFPRKKGLLNIFFWVSENSGVGYYRQYLPALKLREQGLANVMISDFKWGIGEHQEPDQNILLKIMNWADLVVVGRKDQGQFYAQWGAYKGFFNIPMVIDTDDNILHVRPSNPGYSGYHPGSEAITWNQYGISKVFDVITVSTKNLIKVYEKYNPKIFHLPNNLDVKEWNKHPKTIYQDGFTRIGFIASASHPESVQIIKEPILEILRKYPKTKFLISKMYISLFEGLDVSDRIEGINWIDLENWPRDYKKLGLDIGLAPLADNLFNRAKSNLRWMEYSLQGVPSVVSPVLAYDCVRNGIDGIIAKEKDEWYKAIEKLVLNPKFAKEIGENAKKRIEDDFDIDKNINKWLETYTEVVNRYHEFFGKKKSFIIGKKGLQERRGWKG